MIYKMIHKVINDAGVVTGAGWQKFIALLNSLAYLIFGVPVGVLLGFKFHMGVKVTLFCHLFIYLKFFFL